MTDPVIKLIKISQPPRDPDAFESWLGMKDALAFLRENGRGNELVVYAGTESAFIHTVAVPRSLLTPPNIEDLLLWSYNPYSSWGIVVQYPKPVSVSVVPPLHSSGSATLEKGEQLVFLRSFEGRTGTKGYFEVLQRFTHLFGLHFLERRNAYCRLDKNGDIEEVIRLSEFPHRGAQHGGRIITFNRVPLDEYLILTDSAMVRMFDFSRVPAPHFMGWSGNRERRSTKNPSLFYRIHIEPGHASYMRGCQVLRSLTPKDTVLRRHEFGADPEKRRHASFIALDWKNRVVRQISCAPGKTANYFTKSRLPFETSPAFFRPEVLSKFKLDTEKYQLKDRSITCRGAWHLQSYDINEAGQVHTYIIYLRNLPYDEQLYWKSFNERPKGTISKRAFESDFLASWSEEYDPLNSLKDKLRQWEFARVPWWTLRSEGLFDLVHYPVTASHAEWSDEILHLDQLVVEGFEVRWLRRTAQGLGRTPDEKLRSLALIEECLNGLGYAENHAREIVAPLRVTNFLRSKLKGHASGEEAVAIRKQALEKWGSYKNHFRALANDLDESVRAIAEALEKSPAVAFGPKSSGTRTQIG